MDSEKNLSITLVISRERAAAIIEKVKRDLADKYGVEAVERTLGA